MSSCCALLLLALQVAAPADPAKDIASNDATLRLAAARTLAEKGHPDAEKLLTKVLDDEDWEIAIVAATELGELGAKKELAKLLELSMDAPVRGLRRAAAEALGRIDALAAYEKLVKALSKDKDEVLRACEAIEGLRAPLEGKFTTKALEKLLDEREAGPRRAAARALVAIAGEARAARLKTFLESDDLVLRAGVIEVAGRSGDAKMFEPLAKLYEKSGLDDVLVRRVEGALDALWRANPERKDEFLGVLKATAGQANARGHVARLYARLGAERDGARALDAGQALELLKPMLADSSAGIRATAAAACGRVASEEALDGVAALAEDADGRVRRIALGILARARGPKHDATRALLLAHLAKDGDVRVRETAASYLGVRNVPDVLPVLEAALADPDWRVMTSAAVSLGMTQDESAAQALVALFQKGSDDWRVRASAVAGLVRSRTHPAVPVLIAALTDAESLVSRTAYDFLRQVSKQEFPQEPAPWTKWWAENQKKVILSLPEEVIERRKKLGYGANQRSSDELFKLTYQGVDVLVLQSRGDHIEEVLEDFGIEHRRTSSGQVLSDGLHPQGVFVSNCTGEITPDEASRLSWFVRAGGALFGSCWALHETIETLEPGLVRKLETRGEVLADVPAYPCDADPRYLEGVFLPDSRPIYHLEGAHLIEVLDPEEVEVLVDSPQCAQAFGGGNLAAWFRLGHGVVLDSVNHFEKQGFLSASPREPVERMAYAIDHLGLSYERLREIRKEKFWAKTNSAAEHVKDLSVFRLITNFVWLKLLAEE